MRGMNRLAKPLLLAMLVAAANSLAQPSATNRPAPAGPASPSKQTIAETLARLRDEGTNRSRIMETYGYLTDVIGPRLTGSPNCRRANEWTRDQMASWGLRNAQLQPWGPFGRGWSLSRFSAQIIQPQAIPLVAWPKAWSCGLAAPVEAEVVHVEGTTEAELEKYKGKLKGRIALVSTPRDWPLRFEALATRQSETNLLRLANAAPSSRGAPRRRDGEARPAVSTNRPAAASPAGPPKTNETRVAPGTNQPARAPRSVGSSERLRFAVQEGAVATVSISAFGDGASVLVGSAEVPPPPEGETNRAARSRSPWSTNAASGPPQIVLAAEHYNRLAHMIRDGARPVMALEVQTQFHDQDLMAYNTIADIPGTDRAEEVVMLGAHLDSAPGGTGATDNAAGVAVCMEAVRLIQKVCPAPRRTIRVGLWTGEEQGLLGSRAWVGQHLGYYTNLTNLPVARSPKVASQQPAGADRPTSSRTLIQHRAYKHFSAYYNLDNGAGRIRGIYLQGNEALRPLMRQWLQPWRDLGAETVTAANTGGTDHLSFDAIGLPGFQFVQDSLEYWRSYHNTLDVRERAPAEDLQQAALLMASFVYCTAMHEEKLPRKPLEEDSASRRP
jgi:carboxypeptidase Q